MLLASTPVILCTATLLAAVKQVRKSAQEAEMTFKSYGMYALVRSVSFANYLMLW